MMHTQLVTDGRTLRGLQRSKKIQWPIDKNPLTRTHHKYVDEVSGIGMNFKHNGKRFQLVYHDGCFFPFVYLHHENI